MINQKMSKETSQCINSIQQDMIKTQEELKHIKQKLENIPTRDETRADNLELVNNVLKETDKRYASKNVEKIVFSIIGLMGIFIISSLLNLI